MPDRSGLELEAGERLHYRAELRRGGDVAVTEDRVLVRSADDLVSVPYENLSEVNYEEFDWFLAIISVALVGLGAYGLTQNPLLGLFFALAGLWSLYRLYRLRGLVRIHTHSQPKPLELYPEDVDELYGALEPAIEAVREERREDGEGDVTS